jgi:hypothetical protein
MTDERANLPSASNWARYETCAGSYQLGLKARELGQEAFKESPEATGGERIHAWLAGETVELTKSELTSAQFLRERADDQVKRIFGDAPVQTLVEQRLWLRLGLKEVASGRFDRVVICGSTALLQDFKTGFRESPPAELNSQLRFLAVVLALTYPHLTEVIAQMVSGPYRVTETRFDLRQLESAYHDIVRTLARINDERASFNPSVEACRYCPANLICQATKDLIKPVARLQYSELPGGDRAAKLLEECELLERHLEAIRKYYAEMMTADPNYQVPGWGMAPGPSRRELANALAARQRLEAFVPAQALDALASYSIPALEKLLARELKLKGKEAGAKLSEILGELLNVKPGNPVLKRVKGETKVKALSEE